MIGMVWAMVGKLAGALLTLSVLDVKVAHSLGLGELQLNSSLNQPLDAQIQLLNVGELDPAQIRVHLANEIDFNRAGVERIFFLTDLRFSVAVDGKGGGTLFINSHKLVREPFINFLIETRWPSGRLLGSAQHRRGRRRDALHRPASRCNASQGRA